MKYHPELWEIQALKLWFSKKTYGYGTFWLLLYVLLWHLNFANFSTFQRGQLCRLLLAYVAEDCEEVVYTFSNKSSWFSKDKGELDLDFPNLPYYIDGDLKLTQSMTIVRHLGRKYHLYGNTPVESSMIDTLLDFSLDIKQSLIDIAYNPDFVRFQNFEFSFHFESNFCRKTSRKITSRK